MNKKVLKRTLFAVIVLVCILGCSIRGITIKKTYKVYIENSKSSNINVGITGKPSNTKSSKSKKKGFFATVGTIAEFAKNPVGFIAKVVAKPFQAIGDVIQYLANLVQSFRPDNTYSDMQILYSYDELANDGTQYGTDGDGNRNKYTNVTEYGEGDEVVKRKKIKKDKNGNGEDDFTEETEIPLIVGDLYNIAANHIDFIDANLFSGNKAKNADGTALRHDEKSIWTNIRNVVAAIIRINIYIACAILIISLIWFGFNVVRHTFDNPEAKADAKKALTQLANALLMLIGTIIFMTACIIGSQALSDKIAPTDSYELPIRIDVEDTYSFSTTITGYVRYMALTSDLAEAGQTIAYSIFYLVCAIINLGAVILMILRMFFLWGLSIIGPILSIFRVFGRREFMRYETWASMYAIASLMQFACTAIYILILNLTF